jgi:hypothetical protein
MILLPSYFKLFTLKELRRRRIKPDIYSDVEVTGDSIAKRKPAITYSSVILMKCWASPNGFMLMTSNGTQRLS